MTFHLNWEEYFETNIMENVDPKLQKLGCVLSLVVNYEAKSAGASYNRVRLINRILRHKMTYPRISRICSSALKGRSFRRHLASIKKQYVCLLKKNKKNVMVRKN